MNNHKGTRLLYVVYNENLVGSGILRTQVHEMLVRFAALEDVEAVQILSFISPRLWMKERKQFDTLKAKLKENRIDLRIHLMFAALAWGWLTIVQLMLWCFPVALRLAFEFKPTIIHGRVFAATWIGYLLGKVLSVPVVFDPRGPVPDEMLQNGVWKSGSLSLRSWHWIENKLIQSCAATIGVTPKYRDEYGLRGSPKACFVPNRCNSALFAPKGERALSNPPVVVFTGEMDAMWYTPEYIARHFRNLQVYIPEIKLLLVTRRSREYVEDGLVQAGLQREEWDLMGVPPDQVPLVLQKGTFGLVVQNTTNVWPVKFAEFLAAGLPVILNRRAGLHLSGLIEKNRLGITIDVDEPESYASIIGLLKDYERCRARCIDFAVKKLDISRTARQHLRIYRQVSDKA